MLKFNINVVGNELTTPDGGPEGLGVSLLGVMSSGAVVVAQTTVVSRKLLLMVKLDYLSKSMMSRAWRKAAYVCCVM